MSNGDTTGVERAKGEFQHTARRLIEDGAKIVLPSLLFGIAVYGIASFLSLPAGLLATLGALTYGSYRLSQLLPNPEQVGEHRP